MLLCGYNSIQLKKPTLLFSTLTASQEAYGISGDGNGNAIGRVCLSDCLSVRLFPRLSFELTSLRS